MRYLLTVLALAAAVGQAARADEALGFPSLNAAQTDEVAATQPVSVAADAATMGGPPRISPPLPHYYGRGEWNRGCGCGQAAPAGGEGCGCQACSESTWGQCANCRTYHKHLWDNYCYESTRCPCCGHSQGRLLHYLHCERECVHCPQLLGTLFARCRETCGCAKPILAKPILAIQSFAKPAPCAGSSCGCVGSQPMTASPAPEASPDCQGAPEMPWIPSPMGDAKSAAPPKAPVEKDMGSAKPPMTKMPETKQPETKSPMKKEPAKDMKDMKNGKLPTTTFRAVPVPRQTSLMDRLLPRRPSGSR